MLIQIARRIRLESVDNPFFTLLGWKGECLMSGRVAPGVEVPYILKFTPEENIDYCCNIVCVTEREKFVLPVRAISDRAILDFPDEVDFKTCPVKYSSPKTLLIRNIGSKAARFSMSTTGPFHVSPQAGFLEVGEHMQLEVSYLPQVCYILTKIYLKCLLY